MKNLIFIVLCASLWVGCKKEEATMPSTAATDSVSTATTTTNPNMSFADLKYTEVGKKSLEALSKGDMDAYMANYADNARYYWNAGDSLVGKPAISDFWTKRRKEVIETIIFSNDIWLPVNVNKPQQKERTGVWLLGWYQVTAKYKGGSTMTQWIHMLFHFDANDKIDEVNQYVDKVPINAAMPKNK